jgi:hypothetical protein
MTVTIEPMGTKGGADLTPAEHQELIDRQTILARVKIDSISFRKQVSPTNPYITVGDANREWVSHSKRILKGAEVEAIHLQEGRIRKWLKARSFQAHLEAGCYLIPLSLTEKINDGLKQFKVDRAKLVDRLVDSYKVRISESKQELNVLWNAAEYPSEEQLRSAFTMEWWFRSALEVAQHLGEVSNTILEEQMQKRMAEIVTLSQTAEAAFYDTLHDLVKHLVDSLGRYDDGTPRKFRNSSVGHLTEFLSCIQEMNVWGNEEIARLGEQVKLLLNGTTPQELRKPGAKREEIRLELGKVSHVLSGLLVESSGRKFKSLK